MLSIVIRTVILYILLSFSLRITGKRQLGELDVSELVSTLLISEIASIPIDDPDIPMLNAIIPILLIASIEIIISAVKNRSERLKAIVEGTPDYIIYKGRILQQRLYDNRISINELLSELRSQGIGNICEVEYAILEQSGSLSVMKKGESRLAHTIVIDGRIIEDEVKKQGYNETWVKKRLTERKLELCHVLIMTVDDGGRIDIVKKDGSF